MIATGATVGRWRVVRAIGRRGFVARAAGAAGFDRLVQLQIVDAGAGGDAAFAEWARRAQAEAVVHPGLIQLLDTGRDDGDCYVVTEYVPGAIAAELSSANVLAPGVIARITADVADALTALHAAGRGYDRLSIRDIVVGADGHARVTGYWGGGLPVAPAAPADPRDDVRALGAVVFELIAGDGTEPGTMPARYGDLLRRARVDRPEDRPPTVRALADAIAAGRADHTAVQAMVLAAVGDQLEEVEAEVRATTELHEAAPAQSDPDAPPFLDDNVQFTVYRPKSLTPGRWYPLLAFAHLSERRDDAEASAPDPIEEVRRQAEQVLGAAMADARAVTQDARTAVPREGEITFVPEVAGVTFNPPRRSFLWEEPVHREEFRMRAPATLDGKVARGRLTVYLGRLVLAEVALSIRVDARPAPRNAKPVLETEKARAYRRIFASYSHKDTGVVTEVEKYARALGDEYVRDWVHLRTGEVWSDRLRQLISGADVFQLFWSHNSMRSTFVRQEWEYALSLGRPSFVRPTYWEDPMPRSEADGLPPEELLRLHFQRIHTLVGAGADAGARPIAPQRAHKARADHLAKKAEEASRPKPAEPPAEVRDTAKRRKSASPPPDMKQAAKPRPAPAPPRPAAPVDAAKADAVSRVRSVSIDREAFEDDAEPTAPAIPANAAARAAPSAPAPVLARTEESTPTPARSEPPAMKHAHSPGSSESSSAPPPARSPASEPSPPPPAAGSSAPAPAPAPGPFRTQAGVITSDYAPPGAVAKQAGAAGPAKPSAMPVGSPPALANASPVPGKTMSATPAPTRPAPAQSTPAQPAPAQPAIVPPVEARPDLDDHAATKLEAREADRPPASGGTSAFTIAVIIVIAAAILAAILFAAGAI